jgi:hypothetical protein
LKLTNSLTAYAVPALHGAMLDGHVTVSALGISSCLWSGAQPIAMAPTSASQSAGQKAERCGDSDAEMRFVLNAPHRKRRTNRRSSRHCRVSAVVAEGLDTKRKLQVDLSAPL